jgi:glucose/arabinose dehydrogenase
MKKLILLGLVLTASAGTVFAQGAQGVLVKQRAKEVVNQSNVRQGVTTPAQPAQPAPPTKAAPATANPKQQNIAVLQADLAAISGKADVSAAAKQRFGRNLLSASQSGNKPSGTTVTAFVDSLAAVLAGNALEAAERGRLAQDLNAIFDCANVPADRVIKILDDVQAILQVSGVRRQDAVGVVGSLKSVASEIQKAPIR